MEPIKPKSKTKLRRELRAVIISQGGIIFAFCVFVAFLIIPSYVNDLFLKHRGIDVYARVIGQEIVSKKNSVGYNIYYYFETSDHIGIRSKDGVSPEDYARLDTGMRVPILVDPKTPWRSRINLHNRIRGRSDPGLLIILGGVFVFGACLWGVIVWGALYDYRKGLAKLETATATP